MVTSIEAYSAGEPVEAGLEEVVEPGRLLDRGVGVAGQRGANRRQILGGRNLEIL